MVDDDEIYSVLRVRPEQLGFLWMVVYLQTASNTDSLLLLWLYNT